MTDTTVKLGVAFDLNGEAITLEPKQAISQIKEEGIDLQLPAKVELGAVGDGINSILRQLGSDTNVDDIEKQLPDFQSLKDAYGKVKTATLNVEKFHAKIPGQKDKDKEQTDIKYTVGLSATWTLTGNETGLTMTGIYFEATNEEPIIPLETEDANAQ